MTKKKTCICKSNVHVLQITSRPIQSHCLTWHRMCYECTLHCIIAKQ